MADSTPQERRTAGRRNHRPHHWRRDLVELAALFTAVTVADSAAKTVVHGPDGPILLITSAVVLAATAGFHTWWARRRPHAPPSSDSTPSAVNISTPTARTRDMNHTTLWRMRTTVRDEPGSLAALCTALAGRQIDILSLQTHPLGGSTVDEFLLRAPRRVDSEVLEELVTTAGGTDLWLERADAHDLVDAPTRVLSLATRTALDSAELPLALRQLLGRCTIRSEPARPDGRSPEGPVPAEGVWEETRIRLRAPDGGALTIERPQLPFTPTEFARAHALVELDTRLGGSGANTGSRVPDARDVLALPDDDRITVRRADTGDTAAARAMHDRCSAETLSLRYHGPVVDADRYLGHLLSPRFGRTLAVETASNQLIGLGHLLWDGNETEVALIVEDAWQRRGIGTALLRRLIALADESGCEQVYAVAQASNTGMIAVMRSLGLPLEYQVEEGTMVISAALSPIGSSAPVDG